MEHRNDDLLMTSEVCSRVRLNKVTLWRMWNRGDFPKPDLKIGQRKIAWYRQTVENWLHDQQINKEAIA